MIALELGVKLVEIVWITEQVMDLLVDHVPPSVTFLAVGGHEVSPRLIEFLHTIEDLLGKGLDLGVRGERPLLGFEGPNSALGQQVFVGLGDFVAGRGFTLLTWYLFTHL